MKKTLWQQKWFWWTSANIKTHNELKKWVIEKSREKDYLVKTDVAMDVYDIIGGGPVPKHIKPIWPFIAFTAFNTLPKEV